MTPWKILHVFKPKTLFDGFLNPKIWEYPDFTTEVSRGDPEAGLSVFGREEPRPEEPTNSCFSSTLQLEEVG
jgi:hypothetical protein